MRIERVGKKTMGMAAVACCLVVVTQTPALAHDRSVPIRAASSYYYGRIQILQSHHRIKACDERSDGVGVWVEFYTSDGLYHTLDDANGNGDPCGSYTDNSVTITQFRGWARSGVSTGWQTA